MVNLGTGLRNTGKRVKFFFFFVIADQIRLHRFTKKPLTNLYINSKSTHEAKYILWIG